MIDDTWFSPASIKFSRSQIIWVITYMELIETGSWPSDFKYTGYTGGKKSRRFGPAYFEAPLCISAEVKKRLELTKKDGTILYWQIQSGITRFEELEPEAQMALNFISLFDFRKRPKYFEWKKWRKYYYKTRDATETVERKLNNNMASGMWASLKGAKLKRPWESLVGYTRQQLMHHLELKFKDGMSWENYGKWHVDHIMPKSGFQFDSAEDPEFHKCWALSNLQPLWAKDNIAKGGINKTRQGMVSSPKGSKING